MARLKCAAQSSGSVFSRRRLHELGGGIFQPPPPRRGWAPSPYRWRIPAPLRAGKLMARGLSPRFQRRPDLSRRSASDAQAGFPRLHWVLAAPSCPLKTGLHAPFSCCSKKFALEGARESPRLLRGRAIPARWQNGYASEFAPRETLVRFRPWPLTDYRPPFGAAIFY